MTNDLLQRARGMYSPMELQSRTIQNAVNIMASFAQSEVARERAEIAHRLLEMCDAADEDSGTLLFRYYAEGLRTQK